ncbi:MAG: hypothetical protein PVF73_11015 [Bacteroidales bacterium]
MKKYLSGDLTDYLLIPLPVDISCDLVFRLILTLLNPVTWFREAVLSDK